VERVIPGWREALKMMHPGSKWRLWIPPSLGYGENTPNDSPIGPNMVLIFDVELLNIQQ
jgi:FKBP-type peptidyl-prolyl cis-trans isomerase